MLCFSDVVSQPAQFPDSDSILSLFLVPYFSFSIFPHKHDSSHFAFHLLSICAAILVVCCIFLAREIQSPKISHTFSGAQLLYSHEFYRLYGLEAKVFNLDIIWMINNTKLFSNRNK